MFKGLISIFLIAAAVVVFFTKTKSTYADIKNLKLEVASYNVALEQSKELKKNVDSLLEKYNKISPSSLERVSKLLPEKADSVKFIIELDNIIRKSGLVLKSADIKIVGTKEPSSPAQDQNQPEEPRAPKFFETIPLTMKLVGPYESFFSFLKSAEKNLRVTDINAIKLSQAGAGSGAFYEYSVEASTYWKKTETSK